MNNDELEELKKDNPFNLNRSVKIVEVEFTLSDEETIHLPSEEKNEPPIAEGAT